jgi:hypothetical protein
MYKSPPGGGQNILPDRSKRIRASGLTFAVNSSSSPLTPVVQVVWADKTPAKNKIHIAVIVHIKNELIFLFLIRPPHRVPF